MTKAERKGYLRPASYLQTIDSSLPFVSSEVETRTWWVGLRVLVLGAAQ